jgi:serine/threonine-protein kinase
LQSTLRIYTVDVTGKAQPLHTIPGDYRDIRLSPDGRKLAFVMGTDSGSNIWVKDLDRDTVSRISFLTGRTFYPLWTPDGKGILFRSDHVAAPGLYAVPSDGSGEAKRLISDDTRQPNAFSFSPDGKHLAIVQTGDHGNRQIFTVSAEINATSGAFGVRLGKAAPFLGTSFDEQLPAFSPDGKWLAYMVVTPGASEVYVRPFPGPGGQWQVSTGGASRPRWSRNGRELFFSAHDGRVMVVGYADKGDSLVLGKPRVFTKLRLLSQGRSNNYDVSVDGKRIVAILEEENAARSSGPTHLTFLLNFGDELRRKAPAGE